MTIYMIILIMFIVFSLTLLAQSMKRVPAGQVWLHERLGRYMRELQPGIHFLVPFLDGIGAKIETGEWQVGATLPDGKSADNHPLEIDVDVRYAIRQPAAAHYKTTHPERMLVTIVCAHLKAHFMNLPLQDALREPFMDVNALLAAMNKDASEYGLEIIDVKTVAVRSPRYS